MQLTIWVPCGSITNLSADALRFVIQPRATLISSCITYTYYTNERRELVCCYRGSFFPFVRPSVCLSVASYSKELTTC